MEEDEVSIDFCDEDIVGLLYKENGLGVVVVE